MVIMSENLIKLGDNRTEEVTADSAQNSTPKEPKWLQALKLLLGSKHCAIR